MKVIDENGNPVLTASGAPLVTARTNADPKPYPVCGAKNGMGFPCGMVAGAGTTHKGIGRCFLHGGRLQGPESKNWKSGLQSAIKYPGIAQEMQRLREDRDVFDLREHIYLIEAIGIEMMNNAKTMEDAEKVVKVMDTAAKVIQRLDEIEHGRRYVIDINGISLIFEKVTQVIHRYVPDSFTRDLIAKDIAGIPVGGASIPDISDGEQGALVPRLAMENRSDLGKED